MEKFLSFVLIAVGVAVFAWVGLWLLRFETATEVYAIVCDHLRNSLGLSQAVASVIAVGTGIIAASLVSMLIVSNQFLAAAGLAIIVLGLPLAFWDTELAASQCFDQTGLALCDFYETPAGKHAVSRKDGRHPPSSWIKLRDASHEDVRLYLATEEGQLVEPSERVAKLVTITSCATPPVFFDGGGTAVVYWSRNEDSTIALWDRGGSNPTSGLKLKPMTKGIAAEVCATAEAKIKLAAEEAKALEEEKARVAEQARVDAESKVVEAMVEKSRQEAEYQAARAAEAESRREAARIAEGVALQRAQGYWYWCGSAQAYYPYVQNCSTNWQIVVMR